MADISRKFAACWAAVHFYIANQVYSRLGEILPAGIERQWHYRGAFCIIAILGKCFTAERMNRKTTTKFDTYSELEYRRRWLHQLQSEFQLVCSWYRIALAPPAFRLTDSRTTLGAWDPAARTISISSVLINESSWDTVINVLKHEMAHQYVHEFMGRGAEMPHGQAFAEACGKLGIQHPFNIATGDTPRIFTDPDRHDPDPEYDRRVAKVRKMLSLAGSANENEAAAAMSKANAFIRKYNLERLLDQGRPTRYRYMVKNTGKRRLQIIERRIASLLMDFFYVEVVYGEMFDADRGEIYKTVELLGAMENVSFAGHVYDFLLQRVEMLWREYRKSARAPGRFRKTFILGILQGFREKLETEEKKVALPAGINAGRGSGSTISALVVARDPGLSKFIAKRFPRLRSVRYGTPGISCPDTYSDGRQAGRNITIHKVVESRDGNRGRLLDG